MKRIGRYICTVGEQEVGVHTATRITDPVSVVVPARNEAATIARVIETLAAMPMIDEVVVVDNGSADDTGAVAQALGARVVSEAKPGMGHAIKAGFIAARNNWVMKVDADLDKFDIALFARMAEARKPGVGLIKGRWQNPRDSMPMTRYLVMPAIRRLFPGLAALKAPNSGIYLLDRSLIALDELTGDYAADLDVMLRVHAAGARVAEVDIGLICHDPRDSGHYSAMAETIMAFFLRQNDLQITRHCVVMADGAEQVITAALGVLAAHAQSGGTVTIYLDADDTPAAAALRTALSPFPTALVCVLEQAGEFRASPAMSRLSVFAPYPTAGQDRAIHAALRLVDSTDPERVPELLLMPHVAGARVVDGFRPDVALSIGRGAAIKKAALSSLNGQADKGEPAPREIFQSYASLPGPLKDVIEQGGRSEAGNM